MILFSSELFLSDVSEPARSPVLHKNAQAEEQQPPLADTSIASKRLRWALSKRNSPASDLLSKDDYAAPDVVDT